MKVYDHYRQQIPSYQIMNQKFLNASFNRMDPLQSLPLEISGCDSRVSLSPSFKAISSFVQMKFILHFHFLAERNPIRAICADNCGLLAVVEDPLNRETFLFEVIIYWKFYDRRVISYEHFIVKLLSIC